jgi:2-keto-3-deoxygluconate permease
VKLYQAANPVPTGWMTVSLLPRAWIRTIARNAPSLGAVTQVRLNARHATMLAMLPFTCGTKTTLRTQQTIPIRSLAFARAKAGISARLTDSFATLRVRSAQDSPSRPG